MLLVFGSLNIDLLFRVAALPRPGETVLCPGFERAPGGKGANQAAAAAKAGAKVVMAGRIGDDEAGRFARATLIEAGVDTTLIATGSGPTGIAVIAVDRAAENQIIVASGANLELAADQVGDEHLAGVSTLLCQNEVPPAATFALIERARARGIRTVFNLAPAMPLPARVLDALDVLLVNRDEARTAAGAGAGDDPVDIARGLARRHDLACVVTLGAEGAIAIAPRARYDVAPLEIEPVDTTGAGDAFSGVLAAGLDQGRGFEASLRRASVAAGLTCLRLGAQSSQPSAAEIEARLVELEAPSSNA